MLAGQANSRFTSIQNVFDTRDLRTDGFIHFRASNAFFFHDYSSSHTTTLLLVAKVVVDFSSTPPCDEYRTSVVD